jgi:hypothetical protein
LTAASPPQAILVDVCDTWLLNDYRCKVRRLWEIAELIRQRLGADDLRIALSTADVFVARTLAMQAGSSYRDAGVDPRMQDVLAIQLDLLGLAPQLATLLEDIELSHAARNLRSNDLLASVLKQVFGGTPVLGFADTWLSAAQLRPIVDRVFNGRYRLEKLFTSADLGVSQASGGAYAFVAESLRVSCHEILHIDAKVSVLVQARRAGCLAVLFPATHAEVSAHDRDLESFLEERRREGVACQLFATL